MEIVVLADTHARDIADLPEQILEELKKADLIIHAGDYTHKRLLEQLRDLGNFKGVYGNMDSYEIMNELPDTDIFEIRGFKIGVTHPSEGGSPVDIKERVGSKLGGDLDLIIYGHTHNPANEREEGTIYFNPGSATGAFPSRHRTFGILRVEDEIETAIIKV
jgi:putative phosphoesterase